MLTRKKLGFLVAAAALLLALFYLWPDGPDKEKPDASANRAEPSSPAPKRMQAPAPVARPARKPTEMGHATVTSAPDASRGRFMGQVLSAGTNKPVPGAELVFSYQGSAEAVQADPEGSFVFEPSAFGHYKLAMASAEGFFSYAPEWEESPITLVARAEVSVEGIVVYLTPAIDYQGRVVDSEGKVVAGAQVTVFATKEGMLGADEREILADEEGAFIFHARDYSIVRAEARDLRGEAVVDKATQISHKLTVVLGEGANLGKVDVPFGPHSMDKEEEAGSASVRGRVVDPTGKPVPAFNVLLTRKFGFANRTVAQSAVFDGSGEFLFEGLAPGDYLVNVAASGWSMGNANASASEGGGPRVTVQLSAGASIFGQVLDSESKQPLELAKVSIETTMSGGTSAQPMVASAVTDEEGNFELRGLKAGRRSVVVAAAQHHAKIVSALEVVDGERTGPLQVELALVADGEKPRLDLAGIGVVLGRDEAGMLVRDLISEGGAAEAGILVQDLIVAIDGEPVSALGWDDSIQRIRGPVGSQVELRIRRGDEERNLIVTRKAIRS